MSKCRNITLWNQQRRFAKKEYSIRVISALDASGYIHQVIKDKAIRYTVKY